MVESLGITEESAILCLWCMNLLAYFSLLSYIETCLMHLAARILMLNRDSLTLLDIIKVVLTTRFIL